MSATMRNLLDVAQNGVLFECWPAPLNSRELVLFAEECARDMCVCTSRMHLHHNALVIREVKHTLEKAVSQYVHSPNHIMNNVSALI